MEDTLNPLRLDHPYRGPGPGRPTGLALPPARLPTRRGRRALKRWRYVGAYGPDIMVCAGAVRIGPVRQEFWAVWDRLEQRLHERTRMRRGRVSLPPGRASVRDDEVSIDLVLDEAAATEIEVVTPYGDGYAWTRKRCPVPVHGTVSLPGRTLELDSLAMIDESAGYHPRKVVWSWSAGVGADEQGRPVGWNLVTGIHDSPHDSERTVWVDGVPREVGPVDFADDLSLVSFAEGGDLRFSSEAVRKRDDDLIVFHSRYAQPFGTFAGVLPGGVRLAEGYGVMESHDVRW